MSNEVHAQLAFQVTSQKGAFAAVCMTDVVILRLEQLLVVCPAMQVEHASLGIHTTCGLLQETQ